MENTVLIEPGIINKVVFHLMGNKADLVDKREVAADEVGRWCYQKFK